MFHPLIKARGPFQGECDSGHMHTDLPFLPHTYHSEVASLREQWKGVTSFPNLAGFINSYGTSSDHCGAGKASYSQSTPCRPCHAASAQ